MRERKCYSYESFVPSSPTYIHGRIYTYTYIKHNIMCIYIYILYTVRLHSPSGSGQPLRQRYYNNYYSKESRVHTLTRSAPLLVSRRLGGASLAVAGGRPNGGRDGTHAPCPTTRTKSCRSATRHSSPSHSVPRVCVSPPHRRPPPHRCCLPL